MSKLEDIPGIGPQTAKVLAEHGFADAAAIARATVDALAAVPGFSEVRAKRTIDAARSLAPSAKKTPPRRTTARKPAASRAAPGVDESVKEDKSGTDDDTDGKGKKGKKSKKDKKDKKDKKSKKEKKAAKGGKKKDKKKGKKKG
jgi:Mg-chelatase subunit ChlI